MLHTIAVPFRVFILIFKAESFLKWSGFYIVWKALRPVCDLFIFISNDQFLSLFNGTDGLSGSVGVSGKQWFELFRANHQAFKKHSLHQLSTSLSILIVISKEKILFE